MNVNHLAEQAGIKQHYFSEAFKRHTGIAPHKYILRKRIERARELLETTDLAIALIALECGFGSQSHFTSTYSRLMGISPGEQRKRARLGDNGRKS